jgi:hypothetical protein
MERMEPQNAVIAIVRKMRFTRNDVLQIVTTPGKSAKAYGAAIAAVLVAFAAKNGLAVPTEIQASIASVVSYGLGALFSFVLAWLVPSNTQATDYR